MPGSTHQCLALCMALLMVVGISRADADDSVLNIYLLAGQSNMQGQAYTWDFHSTAFWNVPTMQHLHENQAYMDSLPDEVFTFKQGFNGSWFDQRSDAWAVHYNSQNGSSVQVRSAPDPNPGQTTPADTWATGIQPLSPGFGPAMRYNNYDASMIGVELSMGHRLGDQLNAPVMMVKSATGGTTLAGDWRPPTAVAERGGEVGLHYTNTLNSLITLLDDLDADIANGTLADKYNGATSYQVSGFVWLQGWNEVNGGGAAARIAEYEQNLIALVNDIRNADERIADTMPEIIIESSDQHVQLIQARQAAVNALNVADPGSAVFIGTEGLKDVNYGGLNSDGELFANGWGYHFHARPEASLEMGWRVGDEILEHGWHTGTLIPEPGSLALLGLGGLVILRRRRNRNCI